MIFSSTRIWWNFMPILENFRDSISSLTYYFVEGESIWYGFRGWREVNLIFGNADRSVKVGNLVLRNICVPWYSKHAVKYLLGLVIFIGSVACYGLFWTCMCNWRIWLRLFMVWSSYSIYKASWNTKMYWQKVPDVNPVGSDTMPTSFMGSYVSENGATSYNLYVWCYTV